MSSNRMRVEFHSHTYASKDSLVSPEAIVKEARSKGIDRLIITDHNTIKGALQAQAIDPELVIVGEEIMTSSGELLAAFVQDEIPAGLEPLEVIRRLRQQNAFISVSHPFDHMRSGHWSVADLSAISHLVDAIEIFNARCMRSKFNLQAQVFAQDNQILGTVGSDAHATFELGRATMQLSRFSNAKELRDAVVHSSNDIHLSPAWVHLVSRYAAWRKGALKRP